MCWLWQLGQRHVYWVHYTSWARILNKTEYTVPSKSLEDTPDQKSFLIVRSCIMMKLSQIFTKGGIFWGQPSDKFSAIFITCKSFSTRKKIFWCLPNFWKRIFCSIWCVKTAITWPATFHVHLIRIFKQCQERWSWIANNKELKFSLFEIRGCHGLKLQQRRINLEALCGKPSKGFKAPGISKMPPDQADLES